MTDDRMQNRGDCLCEQLSPLQGLRLGVALYRDGDFSASIEALKKSEELVPGRSLSFNGFFLAMAHWQLDRKDEARQWYDQSVEWMQ